VTGLLAVVLGLATHEAGSPSARTTLAVVTVVSALILGPWMVRGIFISGYPAYPINLGAAPVEWRLPASVLEDSRTSIRAWARLPPVLDQEARQRLLGGWSWIGPWAQRMVLHHARDFDMPWLTALVAGGLGLYCRWRHPRPSRPPGAPRWSFFVAPGAAIGFWFLAAPDPRFATASFAVLAPGMFTVLFERFTALRSTILRLAGALSAGLAVVLLIRWFSWMPAGADGGFHPPPVVALRPFMTRSGLELAVPREGDQCWDGPLTCTPKPQAGLRLRHGSDLQYGFVLEQLE
jgi:hypothetical protein